MPVSCSADGDASGLYPSVCDPIVADMLTEKFVVFTMNEEEPFAEPERKNMREVGQPLWRHLVDKQLRFGVTGINQWWVDNTQYFHISIQTFLTQLYYIWTTFEEYTIAFISSPFRSRRTTSRQFKWSTVKEDAFERGSNTRNAE
ncbi:unnamed protein product [Nesidiocoris tenuis]|uniref:Uncharacterized protein n=1 Tax=Nesidiocoris tenuis TaxID=355587 RepID=A0A6H5HHU6_9HEMI|nr:unnamed protein product [Nesidiocoris tenuis]